MLAFAPGAIIQIGLVAGYTAICNHQPHLLQQAAGEEYSGYKRVVSKEASEPIDEP